MRTTSSSSIALDRFSLSYARLTSWLRSEIFLAKNSDDAFELAAVYGELRRKNFDGFYADSDVEEYLVSDIKTEDVQIAKSFARPVILGGKVLVLATSLYDRGGHTQVLLTWLREMQNVASHRLVITEMIAEQCSKQLAEIDVEVIVLKSSGLRAMYEILALGRDCQMVVLHIHPYDIVSALSARKFSDIGLPVVFYNHADHVFTYGITEANLVCEISDYGESINRNTSRAKGVRRRIGVPISSVELPKMEESHHDEAISSTPRIVLTAGGAYKYSPEGEFLLADFIDVLLASQSNVEFVFVGPTGDEGWWGSRRKNWGGRVRFLGLLPKDIYRRELSRATVYLDSYPVTGGTAFPEALAAGKLCAGLSTPIQGYSKADSLKVQSVEELAVLVNRLLENDEEAISNIVRVRDAVLEEQSVESFRRSLFEIYSGNKFEECGFALSGSFVDDKWIRRKWLADRMILFPQRNILARLSWKNYIKLVCLVFRFREFIGTRDRRQIFLTLITKLVISRHRS